jgi:hypothetical protein
VEDWTDMTGGRGLGGERQTELMEIKMLAKRYRGYKAIKISFFYSFLYYNIY